jgi:quercetin 2,3-dioxygenase
MRQLEAVSAPAPDRPLDVALLGGAPMQAPVLSSGSLLVDTPKLLAQARRDFASGKMGTLDGVPV